MDSSLMSRITIPKFCSLSEEAQTERVRNLRASRFAVKEKPVRPKAKPRAKRADSKLMAAFAKLSPEEQQMILKKLEEQNV